MTTVAQHNEAIFEESAQNCAVGDVAYNDDIAGGVDVAHERDVNDKERRGSDRRAESGASFRQTSNSAAVSLDTFPK